MRWSVFDIVTIDDRPGVLTLQVSGRGARDAFAAEAGGHRWQRVPPTEKRGRVHTSTVTVAIMDEASRVSVDIDPSDLDIKYIRGSGKGGQHRNKTSTCVQLTHIPTGTRIRCDGGRSQSLNRDEAMRRLRKVLEDEAQDVLDDDREASRRDQIGSGMRGDKVRTVQVQNGRVTDHRTGKSMRLREYLRGELHRLR